LKPLSLACNYALHGYPTSLHDKKVIHFHGAFSPRKKPPATNSKSTFKGHRLADHGALLAIEGGVELPDGVAASLTLHRIMGEGDAAIFVLLTYDTIRQVLT
jgi:hypothetical protein